MAHFDKAVGKVPEQHREIVQKHVYAALTARLYEVRRDKQNRLDWRWNREIGDHLGYEPDVIHGLSKLELLAPRYMAWGAENPKLFKLGEEFYEFMNGLDEYWLQCRLAFFMLRSKDISVQQFAEYLTEKQRYFAEQGVVLTSNDDLYYASMGVKPQQPK